MTSTSIILLLGPSGSGKSSLKLELERTYGFESAPKFTTRDSRGTPEDQRDFVFCERREFPATGVMEFESYGEFFGIQLKAIDESIGRGKPHVLTVGDAHTVERLRGLYRDLVRVVYAYCHRDELRRRVTMVDKARAYRWAAVERELELVYDTLACVDLVVNTSIPERDVRDCAAGLIATLGGNK